MSEPGSVAIYHVVKKRASLVNYASLKPFLAWWADQFEAGAVGTPKKLAKSLTVENLRSPEVGRWVPHLTAYRRLRGDARLRVLARFLREKREEVP